MAALCSKIKEGFLDLIFEFFRYLIDQIAIFLSFEPDAIFYPEELTSKAQIYYRWKVYLFILFPTLISYTEILESLLPETKTFLFHARTPTLSWC